MNVARQLSAITQIMVPICLDMGIFTNRKSTYTPELGLGPTYASI